MGKIDKVEAMEILDSRGLPTVKAKVYLDCGATGWAAVPSGASTGIHEALELRDGDKKRFNGKGVLQAVDNVNTAVCRLSVGQNPEDQERIDQMLIKADGTENKSKLGANAILAVSLACARAAAAAKNLPLYRYLRQKFWPQLKNWLMPVPQLNVLNGGKHAPGSVDMQEFMIVPQLKTFSESLRRGAEVYQALKKILLEKGLAVGVGDEGGFMPKFLSHEAVLQTLTAVIKPGVKIALDPAASEFYDHGRYHLKIEGKTLTSEELINLYADWVRKYPIVSIEDGLAEDDWKGFKLMTKKMGDKIQIVGDDLYVTNIKRLQRGIKEKATNAVLINQTRLVR